MESTFFNESLIILYRENITDRILYQTHPKTLPRLLGF